MTTNTSGEKASVDALPCDLDYLPDQLKARAQSELFENEDTKVRCLEQLRSMLQEEKDLLWQDDDLFLLAFLRARKFDVKRAFQLVKNMYTIVGNYERVFYNFNLDDLTKCIEEKAFTLLPYRDSDGSILLLFRVGSWNPEVNSLTDHILCYTLGMHCAIRSPATQVAGIKIITDYKGITIRHLFHVTVSNMRLLINLLQNSFPLRFRGMHVVNQNHLFDYIWMIGRPFMSKKFRERMIFHGYDLESLHKHIHPSLLPTDLGGELPIARSTAEWSSMIMGSRDYLNHVFSFGYQKYLSKKKQRKEKEKLERKEYSTLSS